MGDYHILEYLVSRANLSEGFDSQTEMAFPPLDGASLTSADEPYSLARSQEDGEKDLCAIAADAEVESFWFYLPGKEVWLCPPVTRVVCTGAISGKPTIGILSVIADFSAEPSGYVHYHPHPSILREIKLEQAEETWKKKDWYASADQETREMVRLATEHYLIAETACPSAEDLKYARSFMDANPGVPAEFRIATEEGITKFGLDADADVQMLCFSYALVRRNVCDSFPDNISFYGSQEPEAVIQETFRILSEAIPGLTLEFHPLAR